jgi:hypothetical protein
MDETHNDKHASLLGYENPSLIFTRKAGAYPSGSQYIHSKARLRASPAIFRLGWTTMTMTNTLAYYTISLV